MLAERDQQAVNLDPVAPGQLGFQGRERLLRRARLYIPPAVGDTVDVDVHADAGLTAGDAEHQVGAFRADTGQAEQHRLLAWQLAAELLHRPPGNLQNVPGLRLVERTSPD